MAWDSNIAWCHHTFNPWIGCAKVGPDCQNCYAEQLMDARFGRVKWGVGGTRRRTSIHYWQKPFGWDRLAEKHRTRFLVFGDSLCDVLEDRPELAQWRADYFRLIQDTPNLTWLLLTKRPENWGLIPESWFPFPPANVWFGLSAGDTDTYRARAGTFQDYFDQFNVRFLSVEPMIGDLALIDGDELSFWDWVVVGGESDQSRPGREFNPDWGRDLLAKCKDQSIPFFMKQMGSHWARQKGLEPWPGSGTVFGGGDRAGSDPTWWPNDLLVRQFPEEIRPHLASAKAVLESVKKPKGGKR